MPGALRSIFLFLPVFLLLGCLTVPAQGDTQAIALSPADDDGALMALCARALAQDLRSATLENGLVWHALHDDSLPVCHLLLCIPGGLASEPSDFAGLAGLTLHTLVGSCEKLKTLAAAGCPTGIRILPDASLLSLTLPADRLAAGLEGLAALLQDGQVERAELNAESDRARRRLQRDSPTVFQMAERELRTALFAGNGYAHMELGDSSGIRKTAWTHANEWLARTLQPGQLQLILAGDPPADLPELLLRRFSDWTGVKAEGRSLPAAEKVRLAPRQAVSVAAEALPLSDCLLAFPVGGAVDADHAALTFLAAAFGMIEPMGLRVASRYADGREAGIFFLELSRRDGQPIARAALDECLACLDAELADAQKFSRLRERILVDLAAGRMHAVARAESLARQLSGGRGVDGYRRLPSELAALSAETLRESCRKILDPSRALFAGGY